MKANELMIGDWVFVHEPECKGHQVDLIDLANEQVGCDGEIYGFDDIRPIPLTPEILEKNGFVQNPRSKSRRSHQICTDSVYISWWRGRLNILFKPFIGHSTNHVNVDGKYVHELQHALRLCGIKKEISLC